MKKKIAAILLAFIGIFLGITVIYFAIADKHLESQKVQNEIVLLHGIRQLTNNADGNNPAGRQLSELENSIQKEDRISLQNQMHQYIFIYAAFAVCYILISFLYIYQKILKPFDKLKKYAGEVAKGNLDVTLQYERTNFFGDFTWAFDHMRKELNHAKHNEQAAIEENKTIIATLSHDIKTPIASIHAYAEGLEAGLDSSYEKREKYVQVIMKKCDEVTGLTNDLVLHSLSELDKLELIQKREDIGEILQETLHDLEFPYITLKAPVPSAFCMIDKRRMEQVIENILNNARKYAPDKAVDISAQINEETYEIHIRDHGPGIPPEDLPFICDKFYRGKNAEGKPGSGLGLFIVKYILSRMDGDIQLKNCDNGLEVLLLLKIS